MELIEFLKSTKLCTLNGRLKAENDAFTFVSSRGKSVVDYILTAYTDLKYFENFEVKRITEIIDDHNLHIE